MATEFALSSPELQGVIGFLQLEREVRQAGAKPELGFVMVNETIRLLPYRQAYWLIAPPAGGVRLEIASSLAEIERNAPFVAWLEDLMAGLTQRKLKKPIVILDPSHIPTRFRPGWAEWRFGNAVCGVVRGADGQARGLLLLARDQPFGEPELDLFGRLIEVYDHAWRALDRGRVEWRDRLVAWSRDRRYVLGGVAALLVVGLIPVRQTALGQAEIVADQPAVVAAPFDGVIKNFWVHPNDTVAKGQKLFSFDDVTVRNRLEVARRSLATAEAEHMRTVQRSFADDSSRGERDLFKARAEERAAEVAYDADLLNQTTVVADRPGVVLFSDENDWIGRPVQTGEKIAAIADPEKRKLRVFLPAGNLIPLEQGGDVTLFLDIDPLHPIDAKLSALGFLPEQTGEGVAAYRFEAQFTELPELTYRIGLRGTARLAGNRVTLFYYVLRRPLASVRQALGL
jgi:hypothetical protein